MKRCWLLLAFIIPVTVVCVWVGYNENLDSDMRLENVLSRSYDIVELESYIKSRDVHIPFNNPDGSEKLLFYHELNEKFPVEVLRYGRKSQTTAYSVYRVTQGGYYYVFWTHATLNQEEPADWEDKDSLCVLFSEYIGQSKSKSEFQALKSGVSTAKDVILLDPYAEYVSLSHGYYMYCVLNSRRVLKIKCVPDENFVVQPSLEHLLVEEIETVARKKATFAGNIWNEDIPEE